jgi:hypothetical protein
MSTRARDPERERQRARDTQRERERKTENERRGGVGVEQIHSQNWGEEMGFSFTNTSHFSSKKMGFIFMIC